MFGLVDGLKIGGGVALGGVVVGCAMLTWMNLVTIPAAESVARQAGIAQCEADVAKEHDAELDRQAAANQIALQEAQARERALAEQAETLNEQLLDLANAITSDDSSARLCLGADRVRDLNAIR